MQRDKDYEILEAEADLERGQLSPVRILKGPYAGVKYKYGSVEAGRHPDKGALIRFKFQYVLLDANGLEGEIEKDKEFVETVGQILNSIMLESYQNGAFIPVGE